MDLFVVLALLVAQPVVAEPEAESVDGQIEDLDLKNLLDLSVSTASLRAQPFAWTPSHSIVVTKRQIKARGYVNLKHLLTDLPGVDVYNNYSEELPALISFRGLSGAGWVILENG